MESIKRVAIGLFSILLFIFGLQLLGESTQAVTDVLEPVIEVLLTGDLSSLGAGWFLAYMVLTGATSAALGISFLESGLITVSNTYMMVSGARLGAAFIVVFIGFLEYVRGKNSDLRDSCSIGILQFLTTYLIYIPAVILGYLGLRWLDLSFLEVEAPAALNYGIDMIFRPMIELLESLAPSSILFLLSIVVLVASLKMFDAAFKGISEEKFRSKYLRFQLSNKWVSFGLGGLITLVTTSVALSVGIIVPLYNRGYFKRKEILPYLMGANLTTMISSVIAATVIGSATGMKAVLVLTLSLLICTITALVFYDSSYKLIQKVFNGIMMEDKYLTIFVLILVVMPLALIVIF